MFEIIKATSLFEDLDDQTIHDIAQFTRLLEVVGGEVMLDEGSSNDYDLFVVIKGTIGFTASFASMGGVQNTELPNVGNELFGEVAWLMSPTHRTIKVQCTTDTQLLRINGTKLHGYLASHPEAGYKMMVKIAKVLSMRLTHLTQHVRMLSSYIY